MNRVRRIVALTLVIAIVSLGIGRAQAQQQWRSSSAANRSAVGLSAIGAQSRLTGVYRLDVASSDDPRAIAERAAGSLPSNEQQRVVDDLTSKLTAPDMLAVERRNQTIDIASSRAPRISFDADGRERTEQATDGHTVRTRAVLYGDQLMVTSSGSPDDDFSVSFDPIDEGRRLRVTRRIHSAQLNQPLVIQSIYDKISNVARWNILRESPMTSTTTPPPSTTARIPQPFPNAKDERSGQQQSPPIIRIRPPEPQPPTDVGEEVVADVLTVPNGTQLITILNNDLSTAESHEGDRFSLTVRSPGPYEGATIEGYISNVRRAGRASGRSEMRLNFERITLRDGRSADFTGYVENVRAVGTENVRVEPESGDGGGVQDADNRRNRTAQRVAIGAAVGAIIGAIAAGGKGAAIGAAIGAGAGAGSIYAQGRDDLELRSGTEIAVRASAPR